MKIFPLCLVLLVMFSCSACYAQEEEKLTITTYYPSPAGVYATLRIVPTTAPACDASVEGKMYYDGTARSLNICSNSTAGVWGYYPVPGAGGLWALNGGNLTTANTTWNVGIGTTSPAAKLQLLYNGSNGAGGLSQYGIVTTAESAVSQATLGAEYIGDGYANLNLGQNQAGTRRFWHLSSRLSTTAPPYALQLFNFNGAAFAGPFISVSTAGAVTKPSQPAFAAIRTAACGPGNMVPWNNVVTNIGGYYNSATGLFTAPVTGMYMFGFHVLLSSSAPAAYQFSFRINTSTVFDRVYAYKASANSETVGLTDIVYLTAGDTFGVYVDAGGIGAPSSNRFWGYLLG